MTITIFKQKIKKIRIFLKIKKNFRKKRKKSEKKFFFWIFLDFFLQNHEMRPKIESGNSGDHEL